MATTTTPQYTAVTMIDPYSGKTYTTNYQTTDVYSSGYISPADLAVRQRQATASQTAYESAQQQAQQQAAAVTAAKQAADAKAQAAAAITPKTSVQPVAPTATPLKYTAVTNIDPNTGKTYTTNYQTTDVYSSGYISPSDLAVKQHLASVNQTAYQTTQQQAQQQAAAAAADQLARQQSATKAAEQARIQQQQDADFKSFQLQQQKEIQAKAAQQQATMAQQVAQKQAADAAIMAQKPDIYQQGYVTPEEARQAQMAAKQKAAAATRSSAAAGGGNLFSSISDALAGVDRAVRDTVPGGWLTVAAITAVVASGGLAGGTTIATSEAEMIAADAAQLAAQGIPASQIATTLQTSYAIDAATAASAAGAASSTVASGGATAETLTSQGVSPTTIETATNANATGIVNATGPVIPETAIPTVDAAGNAGFYDTATGQTLDAAGNVIAEAPVVPDVPGTELAGPGGIEPPIEAPIEAPVSEPPVTDMGEFTITAPKLTAEQLAALAAAGAGATTIANQGGSTPPAPEPVKPVPLTPIEQTVIPPGSSEVAPVQAQQPVPTDNLPPVSDAVPTQPGTPQPGLGGTTLAPITATDLALGVGGALLADKILTPEPIKPKTYEPLGPVAFGTAIPPVNPGMNPGYLLAPGAIQPQYAGTPTQTHYYYGQRPLIQDVKNINQFNTAVPATNPFAGAAYAQGVGPNKLDVNQFIQQYLTPEQYLALTGSSAQYPQTSAQGTSYAGGPVAP